MSEWIALPDIEGDMSYKLLADDDSVIVTLDAVEVELLDKLRRQIAEVEG